MVKTNENYEYYKPQNGASLAIQDSGTEESNDSDRAMFALPKRKIIRPKISSRRRQSKKLCHVCCAAALPIFISFFIVGTLSSVGYILLGINGIHRDLKLLRIRLNEVESSDKSTLQESKKLQDDFKQKLSIFNKDKKEIDMLKKKVNILTSQVKTLNKTVTELKSKSGSPGSLRKLSQDVKQLQKGMADSGSEKSKLQDGIDQIKKHVTILAKIIHKANDKIFNISVSVAKLEQAPIPTRPPETRPPLVVTVSPEKEDPRKDNKFSVLLKNVLNGYKEFVKNKTVLMKMDLSKVSTKLEQLNETHRNTVVTLTKEISTLKNITNSHEEKLKKVETRLADIGPQSSVNVSSSLSTSTAKKLLITVKEIVEDLKMYHAKVNNLTEEFTKIRNSVADTKEHKVNQSNSRMLDSTPHPTNETDNPVTTQMPQSSDDQSTKETPVTTSITVTEKSQTNSSVVHVNSTSGPEITASLSAKHLNTTESTIQLNAAKATTKSKRSESTFEDDVKVPREMSDSSQVNEENESNPFMSDAEDQNDNGFGDDDSGINGQGEPLQSESFEDTRRRPEDALDSLDEQGAGDGRSFS